MSTVEQGATVRDYGITRTGTMTTTTGKYIYDESSPNPDNWKYLPYDDNYNWKYLCGSVTTIIDKKGGDNMRYLYEVILVNPKDENFEIFEIVAKTEISALMQAYEMSDFAGNEELELEQVEFDDLKTQCRVIMEWRKEKSLEKALETIKKAIE